MSAGQLASVIEIGYRAFNRKGSKQLPGTKIQ